MASRGQRAVNIWVARFLPLILTALIAYSAYVITKLVAIDYLINPAPNLFIQPRPGSAAAILVFYYLLVIFVLICYARLIQTITVNPGYVPRSAAWYQQRREDAKHKRSQRRRHHGQRRPIAEKPSAYRMSWQTSNRDPESAASNHSSLTNTEENKSHHGSSDQESGSTEVHFWQRDIFVCNPDGRPPFCSSCLSHKPDRTHHCSEVNRCVHKMDHFCPWVGGIVSETSFKFFIQFLVYAAIFCVMVLTTMAVFIAERRKREGYGFLNVHYYLVLGISALFALFTLGMAGSSIQFAFANTTTVENLNRRSKVWFLAVLIPRNDDGTLPPPAPGVTGPCFQTITYPRPPEEQDFLVQEARNKRRGSTPPPLPTLENDTTSQQPPRTFAILHTKPGENPFDIGPWPNIREVMGNSVTEWLLPIKQSPCADHRGMVSAFKMNATLVRRLQEEAGLAGPSRSRTSCASGGIGSGLGSSSGAEDRHHNDRHRRKKRRRKWMSEKAASPATAR